MHTIFKYIYRLILSSMIILTSFIVPLNSFGQAKSLGNTTEEVVQSQSIQAELSPDQVRIMNNIATMNSSLTEIIDCYWGIAIDLGIDTVTGLTQAHDLSVEVLTFVDNIFGSIQNIIDGVEYEVGPIDVDFGIAKWADDKKLISFGPWTVKFGEIKIFADLTDNITDQVVTWANVACEVANAITNNCDQREPVDEFPNAEYGCWRECRLPFQLTRIWVNLKGLAELVNFAAEDACSQDIIAVGGGNLSIVCEPVSVVTALTNLIVANVQSCEDNIQGSEVAASYLRLAALRGDHIYSDSVFGEYLIFDLRTRIEINLSGHGNHPHPIASFQLPAELGGHLEFAREIVRETMIIMTTAGEQLGNAKVMFANGNDAYAVGKFKEAYASYGMAYRAATRPHGLGVESDHAND